MIDLVEAVADKVCGVVPPTGGTGWYRTCDYPAHGNSVRGQRIAGPSDLAGLTAVFYSVTYPGFAVPAILAFVVQELPLTYPELFAGGAVLAALSLAFVASRTRSHLPAG